MTNIKEYILISDFFLEEHVGGAELTTEAIVENQKDKIIRKKSCQVTKDFIQENKNKVWILTNTANMSYDIKFEIIKKINKYFLIEYDYKYCKFRNPTFHKKYNQECSCEKNINGKINFLLIANAKATFFMSKKQQEIYLEKFPKIKSLKTYVLGSVFSKDSLDFFKKIKTKNKNNKWAILNSNSPVKGTQKAVKLATSIGYEYEVIGNLSHKEFIKKLSSYKGFIFQPEALDTCPRIVIEAKLLGCELLINNNVQHKDEPWFQLEKLDMIDYLEKRVDFFWRKVNYETKF